MKFLGGRDDELAFLLAVINWCNLPDKLIWVLLVYIEYIYILYSFISGDINER